MIVWEIVEFCRANDILCQGRGSAANSAVCYAIGIAKADPVFFNLLFERFLSPERDGPPDIDLDIESGRREEVIQHVYTRYGRTNTAQVANVISYRPKSAVRDMAKGTRVLDRATRCVVEADRQLGIARRPMRVAAGKNAGADYDIPGDVVELAEQILRFPRHLGIHSGGMVICDRPVTEVCPVEWGRMENRTVLQWDKDDCARTGLVKFDLLGLGMLSALHGAFDLLREHYGVDLQLDTDSDRKILRSTTCCARPTRSVCSRSKAVRRWRPCRDLSRESSTTSSPKSPSSGLDPFRAGRCIPSSAAATASKKPPTAHPLLKNSLERTYGVPLFQEQVMQMAIDVAGLTPSESDQLRQAMSSKRSTARMERLRDKLYSGMAERGITGVGRRRDLREAHRIRALRISRESLDQLRLPRLCEFMVEVALPGRVLRCTAQRPADGFLLASVVGG